MCDFTASICVYCGSRFGKNPAYKQAAGDLGRALSTKNWRLVYGAGDVGLMGAVAEAARKAGANTFGVIPEHLLKREVGKRDLSTFIVTENMHERKKVMFMNSDAVVVLPGGAGSLDEFFEVLTWRQIGLHDKPVFLLNINGFWEPLLDLLDHVIAEGFAEESLKTYITIIDDVPSAIQAIEAAVLQPLDRL